MEGGGGGGTAFPPWHLPASWLTREGAGEEKEGETDPAAPEEERVASQGGEEGTAEQEEEVSPGQGLATQEMDGAAGAVDGSGERGGQREEERAAPQGGAGTVGGGGGDRW